MNGWAALDLFLQTDPRDVGCAEAMDLLHVYADLVAAGVPADERYPGIAAHLRACGPCGQDYEGLLAAIALARGGASMPKQAPDHAAGTSTTVRSGDSDNSERTVMLRPEPGHPGRAACGAPR